MYDIFDILLLQEDIWLALPSVIFGSLAVFTGSIVFMLPETRGHRLPYTIEEAEYIGRLVYKYKVMEYIGRLVYKYNRTIDDANA